MGRAAAVALLLALVASVVPASATFPGRNGDLLVEAAKVGPNGGPQLWLTSPDGRHARLIFTAARCASLAGAQFLPSGTQVVVQESFGCGPIEWGLVLVNTNGGGTRQFFVHSSALVTAVTPGAIAIAPDGRMLADSHVVGLHTEVDYISLGSGRTVRSVRSSLLPPTAWLPSGRLVGMHPGPGVAGVDGIAVADLDGSHVRRIGVGFANANTVLALRFDPAVPTVVPSGDGSRLVVLAGQVTSGCTPSSLARDGSDATRAARPAARPSDQEPIQCPTDLYLVSGRGGTARRLTHDGNELDGVAPVWSPDATEIVLSGTQILDVKTGRITKLRIRVPGRNPTILDWQAAAG